MKKKLAIVASIILLLLGGLKLSEELFGFDILPEMPAITPRQKQLKYLKEHEQEIIDFVKAQNPKIESVQIDWDDVRFLSPDIFMEEGSVNIYGNFNNIESSGWGIIFEIKDHRISTERMALRGHITLGGKIYE